MGGGRREAQGGGEIYLYLYLIHLVAQQKLTQHCKAIIRQLKNKFKKRLNELTHVEHLALCLVQVKHLIQPLVLKVTLVCFCWFVVVSALRECDIFHSLPKLRKGKEEVKWETSWTRWWKVWNVFNVSKKCNCTAFKFELQSQIKWKTKKWSNFFCVFFLSFIHLF